MSDIDALAERIINGDRAALARAITLVESRRADHRGLARQLIQNLLPRTGKAHRIGITGVPGVGKSTTIDTFGANLTAKGHKVAVLAVDPSSTRTGGSILGDKTRMATLSVDRNAFIRPSPSAGTLGGVAARTRETMLLCEAAGFDIIIVETVGIGQSETTVAEMVDVFVVLMLPGAGDELQGIKKGVLEIADIIAVNKADGDGGPRARRAAAEYRAALDIMAPTGGWKTPVMTISGLANEGLDQLFGEIERHRATLIDNGSFQKRRAAQQVSWLDALLLERLKGMLGRDEETRRFVSALRQRVEDGSAHASLAADQIADHLGLPE